jgi:excisionase family DNA binding protein
MTNAEKTVALLEQALANLNIVPTTVTKTVTVTATPTLTPRERLDRLHPDRMLSVAEAATFTGRSRSAIHKLVSRGRLPARRMKGRTHSPMAGPPLQIRTGDLRAYLSPPSSPFSFSFPGTH